MGTCTLDWLICISKVHVPTTSFIKCSHSKPICSLPRITLGPGNGQIKSILIAQTLSNPKPAQPYQPCLAHPFLQRPQSRPGPCFPVTPASRMTWVLSLVLLQGTAFPFLLGTVINSSFKVNSLCLSSFYT